MACSGYGGDMAAWPSVVCAGPAASTGGVHCGWTLSQEPHASLGLSAPVEGVLLSSAELYFRIIKIFIWSNLIKFISYLICFFPEEQVFFENRSFAFT